MRKDFYLHRRGRVWYVEFRDPRNDKILTPRSSKCTNKTAAEQWARKELERIVEELKHPLITFGEWASPFFISMDDCPHITRVLNDGGRYSDKNRKINRRLLEKAILPDPLSLMLLPAIGRHDVLDFRSRMVKKYGRSRQAQQAYSTSKIIIREALFHEMIDKDPCSGIKPPAYDRKKPVAISMEDVLRLLDPSQYENRSYFEATFCAAVTGLRAGEIRGLLFMDLDPQAGLIQVRHNLPGNTGMPEVGEPGPPKWGKERVTAYPLALQSLLEPRRGNPYAYVFSDYVNRGPICYSRWGAAFRKARKQAGIQGITLHGLRHSLNTALIDIGISPAKLQASFGWSDPSIQKGYTHANLFDLTSQSEAIDCLIGGPNEAGSH